MSTDPRLYDDLVARGLIQDSTDAQALKARLAEGPVKVYYGVDPTAPSIHVGNLIGLLVLRRFQDAGHHPLPLAGGATGMIGDPSGKSSERNLLDDEALAQNLAGIVPLLRRFLDFEAEKNPARLFDNRAWTVSMSILDFLRDVGKHATINQMVAKESVRNRMASEDGISYTEFSYMLLQAHDFLWLYQNEGCEMQIGGSDQWGNISLGVDLVRRVTGSKAYALTWPLLLKRDGTKYGKTAGGETMWLSADMLSPYRFYQGWIQVEDAELRKLLLQLTLMSVEEVENVVAEHEADPGRRLGQQRLAREITAMVHGEEPKDAAVQASAVIFGASGNDLTPETLEMLADEIPTTTVSRTSLDTEGNLVPLLVEAGVAKSNSEAMRLLKQNGVAVNDVKVASDKVVGRADLLHDQFCLLRKGKKSVHLVKYR